jgi:hypothetical protein
MLTGARQSTTGIIGQRSTPTQSTVAQVTASGAALAALNCTSLTPVAKVKPIAAAATPSKTA